MNPIKPSPKTEILPIIMLLIIGAGSIYFYQHFPDSVPTHWNIAGEVDGWSSRPVAALAIPGMILGFYLMFLVMPYLDPRKERYLQFAKVYHIFKNLFMFLFVVIYFAAGFSALGYPVPVGVIIPIMIGLLFIVIGNYFGKIKSNWFFGVKTPWTLSSEEVWNKTHRFSGKVFILSGLIMIAEPFLPVVWRMPAFILMLVLILFSSFIYSFILFQREKRNK